MDIEKGKYYLMGSIECVHLISKKYKDVQI